MSTRSFVCVKLGNGPIKAMWVHWNGDPTTRLPFLEKYDSTELAEELVHFRYAESLHTAEMKKNFQEEFGDQCPEEKYYKLSTGDYIFDGEGEPQYFRDVQELLSSGEPYSYVYVWKDYKWVIVDPAAYDI